MASFYCLIVLEEVSTIKDGQEHKHSYGTYCFKVSTMTCIFSVVVNSFFHLDRNVFINF
jgi:hypothetical protein